ncbi:S41 family peptidase [Chryseobacterium sp. H1D6B]|uniref:S41 family peptidase n=1 Tax=Chryseobacterium sp. H1D6B TaxID=2940588 RepID=UPI0015CC15A2|nr:S41 family peptidase [Chryseobacterium sp. H1D6B]
MRKRIILFFLIIIQQTIYAQKEQYNQFMKTWNFLKFYHPDLAGRKIDADSLFLVNIEKVNEKSDANTIIRQLSENLNNKFSGPAVINEHQDVLSKNQDFSWFQKNRKISNENKEFLTDVYKHRYNAELLKGKQIYDEKEYKFPKEENLSLGYRLLALAKIQGSMDYLYPNRYLMDKNFDAYFKDMIDQAVHAASRREFEIILAKIVSKLEDSHAFKFYSQLKYKNEIFHLFYYAPFDYMVFKDYLLVTHLILPEVCSEAQINVGDRITEINGKSIRQIIKEKSELLSFSNFENLLYHLSDYQKNLIWPDDSQLKELKIQSKTTNKNIFSKISFINPADKPQTEQIVTYINDKISRQKEHKLTDPDIAYFRIDQTKPFLDNAPENKLDESIESILKEAASKKAIVFDMRGYPDWGGFPFHYIYKYFSPVHNDFGKYYRPDLKNIGTYTPILPDEYGTYYPKIENKTVHPYKGKVFILVNSETLSASEWYTMSLQHIFPQSLTIGQKTAGADGDIKTVMLPGAYALVFSGIGIFYADNSQTQKVGIRINELIKYTDDDIIQNRDLEFERVLKAVK